MIQRMRNHSRGNILKRTARNQLHLAAEPLLRRSPDVTDSRRNPVRFDHPFCGIRGKKRSGGDQVMPAAVPEPRQSIIFSHEAEDRDVFVIRRFPVGLECGFEPADILLNAEPPRTEQFLQLRGRLKLLVAEFGIVMDEIGNLSHCGGGFGSKWKTGIHSSTFHI